MVGECPGPLSSSDEKCTGSCAAAAAHWRSRAAARNRANRSTNCLQRAPRRYQEDRGRKHHLAAPGMGCKGLDHLSPDRLTHGRVGLLLVDQAARWSHDAGVLGLRLRGRADDVWRLAMDLNRREPCASKERAHVVGVAEGHW